MAIFLINYKIKEIAISNKNKKFYYILSQMN